MVWKETELTTCFDLEDTSSISGLSGASSRHPQPAGHQRGAGLCVGLVQTSLAAQRQSRRRLCIAGGNSCTGQRRFHQAPGDGACPDVSSQWSDRLWGASWSICRALEYLRCHCSFEKMIVDRDHREVIDNVSSRRLPEIDCLFERKAEVRLLLISCSVVAGDQSER